MYIITNIQSKNWRPSRCNNQAQPISNTHARTRTYTHAHTHTHTHTHARTHTRTHTHTIYIYMTEYHHHCISIIQLSAQNAFRTQNEGLFSWQNWANTKVLHKISAMNYPGSQHQEKKKKNNNNNNNVHKWKSLSASAVAAALDRRIDPNLFKLFQSATGLATLKSAANRHCFFSKLPPYCSVQRYVRLYFGKCVTGNFESLQVQVNGPSPKKEGWGWGGWGRREREGSAKPEYPGVNPPTT